MRSKWSNYTTERRYYHNEVSALLLLSNSYSVMYCTSNMISTCSLEGKISCSWPLATCIASALSSEVFHFQLQWIGCSESSICSDALMEHQICMLKLRERANGSRSRNATPDGPDFHFISISYCNVVEFLLHDSAINKQSWHYCG